MEVYAFLLKHLIPALFKISFFLALPIAGCLVGWYPQQAVAFESLDGHSLAFYHNI